jgi:hypothetical protein
MASSKATAFKEDGRDEITMADVKEAIYSAFKVPHTLLDTDRAHYE